MKKIVSCALVLVLTLSMAGCFRRSDKNPTDGMTMPSSNYTTEPTTRATEPLTRPTTQPTMPSAPEATSGNEATNPSSHNTVPGASDATGNNGNGGATGRKGGM